MKKLLLLDADVVIDLHTLGLFDRIVTGYQILVTKTLLSEASYFKNSVHHQEAALRLEKAFWGNWSQNGHNGGFRKS